MKEKIRQKLDKSALIGNSILYFDELDSTNTFLKRLAREGAENGTVVIADFQTAGRGRMDRSFQSPRGKGLYLSVLLRPEVSPEQASCVTALAGIAVCDAVEQVCGVRPGLKWPNDPVLGNRKLCGILTELVMMPDGKPAVVLGIGLNALQREEDFSPEVRSIATSLIMETGKEVSREELAVQLLRRLESVYTVLNCGDWHLWVETYRQDCVHIGKQIRLIGPNGQESVTALDIDERFGLIVKGADSAVKTVRTGEISVRGLFGYAE